MKKILALTLALTMAVALLAGCGSKQQSGSNKSPEELGQLYSDAITNNGGEMVEYNPVITQNEEQAEVILQALGLTAEDADAFGISMSMMNVKAYGIAAVMPAQDKADAVKEGLQAYIDRQQQNFELYLQDQYEVAKNAKLETLEDGTILMVMCEGQDEVFQAISDAIEQG